MTDTFFGWRRLGRAALGLALATGAAQAAAQAAVCPDGASFDSSLGFCSDGTNAWGPFTQAMTDNCIKWGGGPACTELRAAPVGGSTLALQRWSVSFTRSLRGTASCPTGTVADTAYDGRCVEKLPGVNNMYGGFNAGLVARCQELGGGSPCLSTRWNADFYMRVSFGQRLQRNLAAAFAGSGVPSVAVAVSTPDQGEITAAAGVASPTSNPVNPHVHLYRWASVTKHLNAALIMRMQDAGLLNIDQRLAQHMSVPGLAYGSTMTIRQMLNNSAGVADYLNDSSAFINSTSVWRTYTNADIVGYINGTGASFAPGAAYKYSNGGHFLLGMLAEQKLGLPLDTAFQQWLFQPLGLQNIWLDMHSSPSQRIPNLVESSRAYAYSPTSVKAAGAVVATPVDMVKFIRALHTGQVVSAASLSAMKQPQARSSGYGLATILFKSPSGTPYFGHTGTILNYKSQVYYVPSMDVAVALTMNGYPTASKLDEIKAAVYNTVAGRYGR